MGVGEVGQVGDGAEGCGVVADDVDGLADVYGDMRGDMCVCVWVGVWVWVWGRWWGGEVDDELIHVDTAEDGGVVVADFDV